MNLLIILLTLAFGLGLSTNASAEDLTPIAKTAQDLAAKAIAAEKEVKDAQDELDKAKAKPTPDPDEINARTIDLKQKKAKLEAIKELLQGQIAALSTKPDNLKKRCLMERPAFGDLAGWRWFSGLSNWSVGTAVSTQLVRYNFSTKQTSSLTGVGGGPSFRYLGYSTIGNEATAKKEGFTDSDLQEMKTQEETYDTKKQRYQLPIYRIKPECRAKSEDFGKDRSEKLASSMFSLTPTFYISKLENGTDLSVQPAFLVGLFDDIISIGYGFNLTGPQQGKTFLVFGLGLGFKF